VIPVEPASGYGNDQTAPVPQSEVEAVGEPPNEIKNALAIGLHPKSVDAALQDLCDTATPAINDLLRSNLQACVDGGKKGEACKENSDCPNSVCELKEAFTYSKMHSFSTATHCDPIVTYGINLDNARFDALTCSATLDDGLLTFNAKPKIRALQVDARGECGICVDIGSETLESVAVGVSLEVAVDLPTIRLSLRDWDNTGVIDPADPAYVRFLEDSLTTPAVEKAIVVEAQIRDFLNHPLSERINEQILQSLIEDQDLIDRIDAQLNPSRSITEYLRSVAAQWAAGFARTKLDENLQEKFCNGGDFPGEKCNSGRDCIEDGPVPENICIAEDKVCDGGSNAGESCTDDETVCGGGRCLPLVKVCEGGSQAGIACKVDATCQDGGSCQTVSVCEGDSQAGIECDDDSACLDGGRCIAQADPAGFVDRIEDQFALDSFRTTPEGVSITVKGKFSPALIDPEIESTPGSDSSLASAPMPGAPGTENSFILIADDAFDQIFATITEVGNIKQECFSPNGAGAPSTVGDLLSGCNAGTTNAGTGVCVGIQGGNCEALATFPDQGTCHGVQGNNCNTIPVSNLDLVGAERSACRNTPPLNISVDMPLMYCGRADGPPSFWIRDDVDSEGFATTTPDAVEAHVRLNDLLFAVVVDRNEDQASSALSKIPDCSNPNADPDGDCVLVANCLDLNLPTNVVLNETDDGGSSISVNVLGVQQLARPPGAACFGAVSFGANDPLGVQATFSQVVDTVVSQVQVPDLVPDFPLPLTNPRLLAVKTSEAKQSGFDDYLGITSVRTGPPDLCGNGVCDVGENCGYSDAGSCVRDCGLCEPGDSCDLDIDCDTGRCLTNVCQSLLFTDINNLQCEGECLVGGDCLGGVCNFGLCTAPNSLPALAPCSTGAACMNGSCTFGHCEEICGDGFCDGLEVPGRDDEGLSCKTDCGKIPNGSPLPCIDADSCISGVCNVTCVAANSLAAGEICVADAACRSGDCGPGVCLSRCGDGYCDGTEKCGGNDTTLLQCRTDCGKCPNGEACADDGMCQSGVCNGVVCTAKQANGSICTKDSTCQSGICNFGICVSPQPDGNICQKPKACRSGNCELGTCRVRT
jgi:hypothetical protein